MRAKKSSPNLKTPQYIYPFQFTKNYGPTVAADTREAPPDHDRQNAGDGEQHRADHEADAHGVDELRSQEGAGGLADDHCVGASDLIARGTSLLAMFPNSITTSVANMKRKLVHKGGLIMHHPIIHGGPRGHPYAGDR